MNIRKYFAIALLTASAASAQPTPWTLQQCIEHALNSNISIQQQSIAIENEQLELSTARNSRLPNLSASANQSFNFGRGLTSDNTYTNRNTQSTSFDLSTSIPLYTGGQISNTIAVRELGLRTALAELEKAREDVSLQVTSAYLEVLYQKELLAVAQQQAGLSREQLRRAQVLYQNGRTSPAEVAEARASLASDSLSITQQCNALQLSLLSLSQLLELPSPEGFDIEAPSGLPADMAVVPLLMDETPALVSQRPAVLAEELRLESAQRNVRIAQSGYYPSLNLGAGLGSSYYKTSGFEADHFGTQLSNNFNRYLGISLSIPIFNRFATRNHVRQARLQVENQQLSLENTRKNYYKEVQTAYYNALAAQRQYSSSVAAEEASSTAFSLMQKKFEAGTANRTEYEEARTRHLRATSDLLQAKYTFLFRQKILEYYRSGQL